MHVEIYVTHRCGEEKRAKIKTAGTSALEIDLSGIDRDVSLPGLDEAILSTAPREWIFNRKIQLLENELKTYAAEEDEKAHQTRKQAASRLRDIYREAAQHALGSSWEDDEYIAKVAETDHTVLLDGDTGGEGFFVVHPRRWRAFVLARLGSGRCDSDSIVTQLRERCWLSAPLDSLNHHDRSLFKQAEIDCDSPRGAVERYLKSLVQRGVVRDNPGWGWSFTETHSREVDQKRQKRETRRREEAERLVRFVSVRKMVSDILDIVRYEAEYDAEIDTWLGRTSSPAGKTYYAIVAEGGAAWVKLRTGLLEVVEVLDDRSEACVTTFTLPIDKALASMRRIHSERDVQRKAEKERTEKQAAQARRQRIIEDARALLTGDADAWLNTVHPNLNASPIMAATESEKTLDQTLNLLQRVFDARREKASWIAHLKEQALPILKREESVALYLRSADPKLPGSQSPLAYVQDKASMEHCLSLLVSRARKGR